MARLTISDIARPGWTLAGLLALWPGLAVVAVFLPQEALTFQHYRAAHVAAVQLVISLNGLIFWLAWQRSKQDQDWRTVLLALAFLCAVCFDFLYLMRLPGPHPLLPQIHPHEAVYFWLLARLCSCGGLFLMIFLPASRIETRTKAWRSLALALLLVLICAAAVVQNWPCLPPLGTCGQSTVTLGAVLAAGMALLSCLLVWRRAPSTEAATTPDRRILFGVALALLLAQLHFHFLRFDNILNLLGPAYYVLASLLLCMALLQARFSASLCWRWRWRARWQERGETIADRSADAMLITDARHRIIYANAAAGALFGRAPQALYGAPFETCIPRRFHHCYLSYLDQAGDFPRAPDGSSPRLLHEATGLRCGGEEFKMEVSLSTCEHLAQRCTIMAMRDITERRATQRALLKSRDELRLLTHQLQTEQEQERIRFSRYLTEDLSQMLAALLLELSLLRQPQQDEATRRQHIAKMEELLSLSIRNARRTSSALRPRSLDDGGLFYALQSLCQEFGARHAILCEFEALEHDLQLDEARTTALFRIVEKALDTISLPAQASEVLVRLQRRTGKLQLEVRNNGGQLRQEALREAINISLTDMEERVKKLNGHLNLERQPDASTRIDIAIPL